MGGFESGLVAAAVSTEFAIDSGGVACIVGSLLLARLLPGFRHFNARKPDTQKT